MGGGGGMQRRVARVDIIMNREKEVRAWILATCSDTKRTGCQATQLIKGSGDPNLVAGGDRSEERKQRTVVGLVRCPTCLRHGAETAVLRRA